MATPSISPEFFNVVAAPHLYAFASVCEISWFEFFAAAGTRHPSQFEPGDIQARIRAVSLVFV